MIFWVGALLLLQLSRLFFLVKSATSFSGLDFTDLSNAFWYGLRFDASALAYLYLVALGVDLVLSFAKQRFGQNLARVIKVFGVAVFFAISLIDAEYFFIARKRIDASILSIGGDIGDQAPQLLAHYSYIAFSFVLVLFLMWHLSGRNKQKKTISFVMPLKRVLYLVFIIPVMIVVARGGFQEKPMKISSAMVLGDSRVVNLALSTPFVVMHTYKKSSKILSYRDFDKKVAAQILLNERPQLKTSSAKFLPTNPKDNVLVILLESFGSEYSYATPFLNSLKEKGVSFENHYANGHTSIESIPALYAALPSLLGDPYITSPFINSTLHGLPSISEDKNDRDFLFLHGARKGSMYFDSFTSYLRFTRYYGKEDYTGDPSALYDWGVHDHAFLDFTGKVLGEEQKPFVASVFTLSSHQPFEIPKSFQTSLAEAPNAFVRSLRYADKSLELFFKKYSTEAWFKNTLFILTGDHTSQCRSPEACSELGSHKVPLVLIRGTQYLENKNKTAQKIYKITQHADISFTIADYLGLNASQLIPFGHSVLDQKDAGVALFREGDEFVVLMPDGLYRLNSTEFLRCHAKELDRKKCMPADPLKTPAYRYLQAARSYFTQSLDDRNFY